MQIAPFRGVIFLVLRLLVTSLSFSLRGLVESAAAEWNWIPEDEHPCTIQRYTADEFQRQFGPTGLPSLHPVPVVIRRDSSDNEKFRHLTTQSNLRAHFGPDFAVTLSSSNAVSEHRRTITLENYLNEILAGGAETTPDQLANETWYLFGETYTEEWQRLLRHYTLPLCRTCRSELVALSFGIGNRGSGVQWHVHGPGFSEALLGRKHWVLYPPSTVTVPRYHKDQSSRQWMEYVYSDATFILEQQQQHNNNKSNLIPPIMECTLDPGDVIYFPDHWWHATINLDPYTAFVSTFTTEHNSDRQLGEEL
jgi:Cupin-like domain